LFQNSDPINKIESPQINIGINREITEHEKRSEQAIRRLEKRQILDLLLVPTSLNRISRHFAHVYKKSMSVYKIRQVVIAQEEKITAINGAFDRIAGRKITIMQIDETFKGWNVSILVVIDSVTGYILHLQRLEERNEETIVAELNPIQEHLKNVSLVLTDGAPYFPGVVKSICPDARHQLCLIHVMRGLYKYLQPFKTEFQERLSTLQHVRQAIKRLEMKKHERQYTRKKLLQKLKYWKRKRTRARNKFGVSAYQKGILEKYPQLKEINDKINLFRTSLRSLEHTIKGMGTKETKLKNKQEFAQEQKNSAWGTYMVKCRLVHRFYRLFGFTGAEYQKERERFISKLRGKNLEGCELSQEILRLLTEVKNIDSVNKENCPVRLNLNFINTNAIESINSKIRPFLEGLRKITDSHYIRTYFKLLRLYLNSTPPFSGPRKDISPIERYGYELRGRNYLDLLLDGLPPGPQYKANLRKVDVSRAAPNMLGKCIL